MNSILGLLEAGEKFGFPYLVMIVCILVVRDVQKKYYDLIDKIMGPMTSALYSASELFKLNSPQTGEFRAQKGEIGNDRREEADTGRGDTKRLPATKEDPRTGNPFAESNEDHEANQRLERDQEQEKIVNPRSEKSPKKKKESDDDK